jgi:hypothetical protein
MCYCYVITLTIVSDYAMILLEVQWPPLRSLVPVCRHTVNR